MSQKQRKPLGIWGQILLGFGVFILVVGALLWLFQMVLLEPFYRGVKTAEVKGAAESVVRCLEDDDMKEEVREICLNTGINIVVTDEVGRMLAGWKASEKESYLENLSQSPQRFGGPVQRCEPARWLQAAGGQVPLCEPRRLPGRGDPVCVRGAHPHRAQSHGGHESVVTPVDSIRETLLVQVTVLTVAMVVLGVLLALVIARRISRPLTEINNSAKALAAGDYTIRFEEQGAREVRELSRTLNYAAGELSKVEGLRRDLLANVSHDLRTPLTMIKGYSEVMRDLPGENTPENVQIIIDEAQRLTDLVNDLLDLSKLEAGVLPLEKARFNLTESIRQILHRYDKLADYRFPFHGEEDVWVEADELKISQVVYNLVNNAITYSGEDKTITLTQQVEQGKVRISVTDTGEGIPQEKLKDIWERYYKVDKEHKRAQMGSGLGLSIVRNILEMHGGQYGVTSQLGKGSTFWFELPLAPSQGELGEGSAR